jgi:hypothetical protein
MARDTSQLRLRGVGVTVNHALVALFDERDPDKAVGFASMAVAATAKHENPTMKGRVDKERYKKFVRDNADLIWMVTRVRFGSVNLIAAGLDDDDGLSPARWAQLEEILYKVVRCSLFHDSEVHPGVVFSPVEDRMSLTLSHSDPLVLPWEVVYGMLLAVIGSETNAGEKIPKQGLRMRPWNYWGVSLNDLWGKKKEIEQLAVSHLVVGGPDSGINFGVPNLAENVRGRLKPEMPTADTKEDE